MPQDGEQLQPRRRRSDTEGPEYYSTRGQVPSAPRTEPPYPDTDDGYLRSNTSAVRYTGPYNVPTQRSSSMVTPPTRRQSPPKGTPLQQQRPPRTTTSPRAKDSAEARHKRNVHWLFYVGIGMLAALVLWMAGSTVLAWGVQRYDDIKYGYPRTFQIDAVVGHNNDSVQKPSHFIAVNLNRQVIIVELMAGDPSKAVTYVAPVYIAGQGGDLAPVTLEFRDVTGDGRPDMVVHVHLPSQDQISVFVNDGTKFRPSNGNDKIRV